MGKYKSATLNKKKSNENYTYVYAIYKRIKVQYLNISDRSIKTADKYETSLLLFLISSAMQYAKQDVVPGRRTAGAGQHIPVLYCKVKSW